MAKVFSMPLKFGFMKACQEFRPCALLTPARFMCSETEGTAHGYPGQIGIVARGPDGATASPMVMGFWQEAMKRAVE